MAHAGFDWLVIERGINGLDSAEIEHMLMAIDGTEHAIPIVRIPAANPVFIQRALDMGASAVWFPWSKRQQSRGEYVRAGARAIRRREPAALARCVPRTIALTTLIILPKPMITSW